MYLLRMPRDFSFPWKRTETGGSPAPAAEGKAGSGKTPGLGVRGRGAVSQPCDPGKGPLPSDPQFLRRVCSLRLPVYF